jgi:hypothetical protein
VKAGGKEASVDFQRNTRRYIPEDSDFLYGAGWYSSNAQDIFVRQSVRISTELLITLADTLRGFPVPPYEQQKCVSKYALTFCKNPYTSISNHLTIWFGDLET